MTDSNLRELDGWIAEHFLNGIRVPICEVEDHAVDYYSGYCNTCATEFPEKVEKVAPAVSSDSFAFALVKREIERRGWGWTTIAKPAEPPVHFEIHTYEFDVTKYAATEELAGCLAVKAAVEASSSSTPT